jgi:hypothetical protein
VLKPRIDPEDMCASRPVMSNFTQNFAATLSPQPEDASLECPLRQIEAEPDYSAGIVHVIMPIEMVFGQRQVPVCSADEPVNGFASSNLMNRSEQVRVIQQ